VRISFATGGDKIHLESIKARQRACAELGMRLQFATPRFSQTASEADGVPFHNDVQVQILAPKQKVADEPADDIDGLGGFISKSPNLLQNRKDWGGDF
jgi:hypothetical protein